MQKTLWCDSLYRQNFSTLEIHCQLMLVFGNGVLRPHHLGRGCKEFTSGLASTINLHLSTQQIKNTYTAQVLEDHQDTIKDLSTAHK